MIKPGERQHNDGKKPNTTSRDVLTTDTLMDLVRNMFPPNLVEACIAQHQTKIVKGVYDNQGKITFSTLTKKKKRK